MSDLEKKLEIVRANAEAIVPLLARGCGSKPPTGKSPFLPGRRDLGGLTDGGERFFEAASASSLLLLNSAREKGLDPRECALLLHAAAVGAASAVEGGEKAEGKNVVFEALETAVKILREYESIIDGLYTDQMLKEIEGLSEEELDAREKRPIGSVPRVRIVVEDLDETFGEVHATTECFTASKLLCDAFEALGRYESPEEEGRRDTLEDVAKS